MKPPQFVPKHQQESLLNDAELHARKHSLKTEVMAYFKDLEAYYVTALDLPQELFGPPADWQAKAAQGDHYHTLPYQVLDCPRRIHVNGNVFVRTAFVWTIGWSVHVVASGKWAPVLELMMRSAVLSADKDFNRWLRASTVGDWAWDLGREHLALGDTEVLKFSHYFPGLEPRPVDFVAAINALFA